MKRFLSLVLCLSLAVCAAPAALADDVDGGEYHVKFTADKKMETDYGDVGTRGEEDTAYKRLSQTMQPGDTATIVMNIRNSYGESTDWYMSNEIIQSLEESTYQGVDNTVAEGGAYTYRLVYEGPAGSANSRVLYDSNRVGGENGMTGANEGLELATEGLENWLYLDSLRTNQDGKLLLTVALDGESQGNDYQDTLAKLIMRFAVEETPKTTTERHIQHERVITTELHYAPVKTGDESRLLLWSLVMLGCGIAALVLAAVNHRRDRRDRR